MTELAETQEMRTRHQCDVCNYKTTSKAVLTRHKETVHEAKESNGSKRKVCNICGKRFNKTATFNTHMEKVHKEESK